MLIRSASNHKLIKERASPRQSIIFPPDSDKLIQVMGTQDWGISCQVFKVIHNHSHKQVQHLKKHKSKNLRGKAQQTATHLKRQIFVGPDQEWAEEDEGHKVAVSKVGPTAALVVRRHSEGGDGGVWFTLLPWQTGQHDLLPGLPCSTPGGVNTNKYPADIWPITHS